MKKTLLITGGCGFIGTNTALFARRKNYKVIVFDSFVRRGSEENAHILEKNGIEIVRGDIRSYYDIEKLPRVNAIIHLAGNAGIPWSVASPVYDFMTNALGTVNILEYSKKNGKIPVIFSSTNKVYSDEINLIPLKETKTRYIWDFNKISKTKIRAAVLAGISNKGINENFPMDSVGKFPHNPYGVSKSSADLYCQEYYHTYDIPTVVNRMSCVFGLYQKGAEEQGWLDWFIRAKISNHSINLYGNGKQIRDEVWGEDIAKLFILEIENIKKISGQVFNVGGGYENSVSLIEVISYLNKKGGKKLKTYYSPWRANDQKVNITDNSKVKNLLNWSPKVGVYEGIDIIWKSYNAF